MFMVTRSQVRNGNAPNSTKQHQLNTSTEPTSREGKNKSTCFEVMQSVNLPPTAGKYMGGKARYTLARTSSL